MHGRSHTRSPGMSIMRVSTLCNPSLSAASMLSWASQAHAFHQPVCQSLSWLHHWSIPRPYHRSLLSFRMMSRSSMPSHTISSLDLVVTMSCGICIADLSDHCPVISLQTLEVWLLSTAKSRWHEALHSAHKSCTHGNMFWKRGGVKRELVADPWTSSSSFHTCCGLKFTATCCWEQVS